MNEDLYIRLRAKGWTKADIEKSIRIIEEGKEKKSRKIQILDTLVYWFILIVAIIGNIVISIALVPFLLEFKRIFLYLIIIIFALLFGSLFDLLIRDLDKLEKKHVVIAGIFIPALAVINIFYTTSFANYVSDTLKLNNTHNPIIIAIIYVAAFITPYVVYRVLNKKPFY